MKEKKNIVDVSRLVLVNSSGSCNIVIAGVPLNWEKFLWEEKL